MAARVSIADLQLAAEWCASYDDDTRDDDPAELAIHRVAEWLKAEAAHREREANIRTIMKADRCTRDYAIKPYNRLIA